MQAGVEIPAAAAGVAASGTIFRGGYLRWDSVTAVTLIPDALAGDLLSSDGENLDLTSIVYSRSLIGGGNTKIGADGVDTGVLPATNEYLYIYASNSLATFGPNQLRFSTAGPLTHPVYGYLCLDAGTNGRRWVYCGQAFFDNTAQMKRTDAINHLVSYLNPRKFSVRRVPNYVDDANPDTTYTFTGAGYGAPGSDDAHEFLHHPSYNARAFMRVQLDANTAEFRAGIEQDDEGGARAAGVRPISTLPSGLSAEVIISGLPTLLITTLRKFQMAFLHTPGNATLKACLLRNGSVVKPAATYLDVEYYR